MLNYELKLYYFYNFPEIIPFLYIKLSYRSFPIHTYIHYILIGYIL